MADQIKQIKEFPQKPDFGDDDLLLIQGQGTTYHVQGRAVKKYAEDSAKPQVALAAQEAKAAAEAADRAEAAIQHPAIPDPATGNWKVWDQVSESYQETVPPVRAEGQDFEIKGYYPTLEALEAAVPDPETGAAYGIGTEIPYDIYVWDAIHSTWVNNGALQGPRGPQGETGPVGPAGPPGAAGAGIPDGGTAGQILSKASAENQDVEWKDPPEGVGKSMAGQTVEPTQGTTVTAEAGSEVFNDYRTRTYGTDEGYETIVATAGNIATGIRSHAEGEQSTATGRDAHAEGAGTTASGNASHAEGGRYTGDVGCIASGYGSHAEGVSTKSSGSGSHAEGRGTKAEQNGAHAEGISTTAGATCAHAEGNSTQATGKNAHAEGYFGIAEGIASHVEGGKFSNTDPSKASGYASHCEGSSTIASADQAHAEGSTTQATGINSHAEGYRGIAYGSASHVEGGLVSGKAANKASGYAAHSEGASTLASGDQSHAEGEQTTASGSNSHAEGYLTKATAVYAHAEGSNTRAEHTATHAEGSYTAALSPFSHAGGQSTITEYYAQTVIGRFNVKQNPEIYTTLGDYFTIGSGLSESERSNCFRVRAFQVFGGEYNSSGADYAELFEWADGNPEHADRVGRFVTLEGKNIRLAGPGDGYILGIVSGAPSVVGDVYDDQWQGMYLTDVFGRPIFEDVEVPDVTDTFPDPEDPESTVTRVVIPAHTERRQKLNPAYDPNQPYVPRTERPEWDAVGMLGKLVAVDDGTCRADGWAAVGEGGAATASAERTRFRVMERLDESHVRILILVS